MPANKIHFHFQAKCQLTNRNELKEFIEQLFKTEKTKLENLSYIFCTDEFLLKINQQYLQHDFYTDIISFDLSESKDTVGEIYISVDRTKENALRYQTSFKSEIHRVIFHGALHLCGYDDKTDSKKKVMTTRENHYLNLFLK